MACSRPHTVSVPPMSLVGAWSPLWGCAVPPQSGFPRSLWSGAAVRGQGSAEHCRAPLALDLTPCPTCPGPPQTGRGGSAASDAGPAALAMPRARVAAGRVSAMGMETCAVATVTTSAGSASARTTLKVPTASSAPLATMGTPGEPGARQEGRGRVRDGMGQDGTCLMLLLSPPSTQGWWLLFPGVWGSCPPHQRVLSGAGLTPGWGAAASRGRGSESRAGSVLLCVGCLSHRVAAALCPWDPLSPTHPHLLPR